MNLWVFRQTLLSQKKYLEKIYKTTEKSTVKDIIDHSTLKQLQILIQILHLAINGHIKIPQALEKKLKKNKIINALKLILNSKDLRQRILQPKCDLILYLQPIKSILPRLLHSFFNMS